MTAPILTVVDDLLFLSKIQQTAQQLGVRVEVIDPAKVVERVQDSGVSSMILDLNHRSGKAVEVARAIKANPNTRQVQLVAFLSHVQTDLAAAARAAGCDVILARSAFSQQLPQLLLKLGGGQNSPTAQA
jgi:CheY-like chemotaxis protein